MSSTKTLIFVVGPTAVGKTSVAIDLALEYKCEIISADSRQFFKDIAIGTAKPSDQELAVIKHHFVDFLDLGESYSAGQFEKEAMSFLEGYFQENDICICVGGSGLYVNALMFGLDDLPSSPSVRSEIIELYEKEGLVALQRKLEELDPEHYASMDAQNKQRVMRALEVCMASGVKYSELRSLSKKDRPFKSIVIGLNRDREELYDRINKRVDLMLEEGLLEEVKSVYPRKSLNSLQTVGYKEFFNHFDGEYDKEEAIRLVKRNSRRFAKRQITWFNKYETIQWFKPSKKAAILKFVSLNRSK